MHQREIYEALLSRLSLGDVRVRNVSLVCGEEALRARLRRDVERGVREESVIERSVSRIALYRELDTQKLDVTDISADQAALALRAMIA